jgi:transposase-like protein
VCTTERKITIMIEMQVEIVVIPHCNQFNKLNTILEMSTN